MSRLAAHRTTIRHIAPLALTLTLAAAGPFGCGADDSVGTTTRADTTIPPEELGKAMVCKVPPGNPANAHTIVVGQSAVKAHLATGSYLGPCAQNCQAVDLGVWSKKPGKSKNAKVAVCHIPPGNPANAHTIVVSINAVKAHLAHGDILGFCSDVCIDEPHPAPCGCCDLDTCTHPDHDFVIYHGCDNDCGIHHDCDNDCDHDCDNDCDHDCADGRPDHDGCPCADDDMEPADSDDMEPADSDVPSNPAGDPDTSTPPVDSDDTDDGDAPAAGCPSGITVCTSDEPCADRRLSCHQGCCLASDILY